MRIKLRALILPAAAVAGLGFGLKTVADQSKVPPAPPLFRAAPTNPYFATVAGAGIIEARYENVAIGSPLSGIVAEVYVAVGSRVEKGDPLFRLDDRAQRADQALRRTTLEAAETKLARLRAMPRPESLPPARARVAETEALLRDQADQLKRREELAATSGGAVSKDEIERRRFGKLAAERLHERARAELAELEAGAWAPDLAVAAAEVATARAELGRVETEIERLIVRAPAAGQILQRKVRPGEFVAAGPSGGAAGEPHILMGDVDRLHVRVDIDEGDAALFRPGAKAVASLKGKPDQKIPLAFVRVEPYVVPKRSLTGLSSERVDTRVLQVIYAIDASPEMPLYVGQQVDAFIESAAPAPAPERAPRTGTTPS